MNSLLQKIVGLRRASVVKGIYLLFLSIGLLLGTSPALSQGNQGRITGTITDQSGGAMSGATVTVLDVARGVSRSLTTDDSGEYNAPNLLPGKYSVRAEAKGFKTENRENIEVEVGKELRVDMSMQPGDVSQTITITESVPLVETTNATLGGTLSNQTINDLPLNGRNYINLLTLRPGMTVYPGGGSAARSANGTRPEDIGYLLDGVREDDPYTGSSVLNAVIPAGDASTSLPIDAIQEFNTEQNPKAEFGWKPGAIVNAGIKSGSNSIHGTAFAFGRDTVLDARNFFNYANQSACATNPAICNKAPVGLEQYGASLGGAIKKDKLFYFVNYEGQNYSVGSTLLLTPPLTVTTPGGPSTAQSLVDACNAIGFAKVTALSAQLAGLNPDCSVKPTNLTPGANESLFPTNTTTTPLPLGMVSNNTQENGVAKVDYHINEQHSLSGMYFNGRGGGIWNDGAYQVGLPGSSDSPWMSNLYGKVQVGSGAWTWTPTSNLVNQFRAGYAYFHQTYDSVDASVNPLAYGIDTGVTDPRLFGFPFIRINPFSATNFRLGGNWPKHPGPTGALEILDHVSVLRGKHAFMFGGEAISNTADVFVTANGKGSIRFTNLTNFLEGNIRSTGTLSQILTGNPERHLSNQGYAAFVQDDWHIKPRLTVNLGLRYEIQTVLTDRDNQLGNFDPNSPTGLVQVGFGETSAYHGDHKNFSPRVGFAWDVQGNGKTVVRGGGSIMYEQLPYSVFIAVGNQLGLNQVPTGATQVFCSANPCVAGSTQIVRAGQGNMNVLTENVTGASGLSAGWQAQTAACVGGGTTACGSIFPASAFADQCGDGLQIPGLAKPDPAPCSTEALNPNMRTPYVSTWSLGIQRAITNDFSLDISYVGNHGTKFLGFADINEPPLGAGYNPSCTLGSVSACEQAARPYATKFPYLAQIDQLSNIDKSNYDALQATLTMRPTHGLSMLAGYTYGHALDNASANFGSNFLPVDSTHPAGMYGNSDFDIRHRLTLTTTYVLPGKKSPGQLLEGWQLNSVVTLQGGSPWTPEDMSNDFSGTGQVSELDTYGQFWNISGPPTGFTNGPQALPCYGAALCGNGTNQVSPTIPAACTTAASKMGAATLASLNSIGGCYMEGNTILIPPALGTIGNTGRGIFRGAGFKDWDVSVVKDEKFKERLTAQFRAEFFNVLNHPNLYNPTGPAGAGFNDPSAPATFGCGCNTPDQASPNPVLGTGAARSIQLGLKLIW
ncbi:MAG TPA: TonB-dependent receptor [Candidatus Acidoferrales bacterium]|jgi:outer membrane receptor protein involved in Fe transport|nr:TonB-dependent receptor [Candidatus Acidoferrales bacterium]